MSSAPLLTSPWRSAPPSSDGEEGVSAGIAPSDDWLSWFNFSDLPPAPSTPADLPEILDVDCFDLSDLLPSGANPLSLDLSDGNPPSFHASEGFSSFCEPHKVAKVQNWESVVAIDAVNPSLHNDSSAISSSHNSDAGSSIAAPDSFVKKGMDNQVKGLESYCHPVENCLTYLVASSYKRERGHEDIGSDMEGVEGEGKSQLDPLAKKQQRLLRNRELAFESRQRKKCYIGHLEVKCKRLEQERNYLQQQVCFSAAENAVLKEELARMKKLKSGDGVTEPAVLLKDSLPLEFLSLLICLLLMAQLSLCVSPFLALVPRAVVRPQSPIEVKGLLRKQGGSKRGFHYMVYSIPWSVNCSQFHKPFQVYGVSVACG